jgi:hypothetical protein
MLFTVFFVVAAGSTQGKKTVFQPAASEWQAPLQNSEDRVAGRVKMVAHRGSTNKSPCTQLEVEHYCLRLTSGGEKKSYSAKCENALVSDSTQITDESSCYIPQKTLNRALMEASTTCVDNFGCLEEMQRQLIADCALCLSARQRILLPAMEPVNHQKTTTAESAEEVPRRDRSWAEWLGGSVKDSEYSAADCTHKDVEMFCLRQTFPARFYKHSNLFIEGTRVCFPYIAKADEKCQIENNELEQAYFHATKYHPPDVTTWAKDYNHYKKYMAAYQSAREDLVRKCRVCVAKEVPDTKSSLRNGEHYLPPG